MIWPPLPFAVFLRIPALLGFILAASLGTLAADSATTGPALKEIIIVYKTHFDIGYTQLARDVCHQYRTEMADKVIEAIDRNANQPKEKQFVWTLSGYPMSQILGPEQAPDRRERISRAIRSGNLAVHALAFSMHDETFEPEDRSARWAGRLLSPASTGCRCRATPRPPMCPAIRGFCPPCSRTPG